MSIFSDLTTTAVEWALTAQSERQRVHANNIANVNTPGFRSSRLHFEKNLAVALDAGDLDVARYQISAANTPQNINGNDVALEQETTSMMKSGIHYDALVQALNFKFSALRSAIGAR